MYLKNVVLTGIRNLQPVRLGFSSEINAFYGQNGGGKTSLLEALYLLSLGRSFRTRNFRQLVSFCQKSCLVAGDVACLADDRTMRIGLEKNCGNGKTLYKVNESLQHSATELTKLFPVQLVDHRVHELIAGSANERRQFLDWGVFHMEHEFLVAWRQYQRLLKHRNMLLKQNRGYGCEINQTVTQALVASAMRVHQYRCDYLERFAPLLTQAVAELLQLEEVAVDYYWGWDENLTLQKALENSWDQDQACRYTNCGPHRADVRFRWQGKAVKDILSRGQQKLFGCALMLTRAALFKQQKGASPVFLLDDLAAELDSVAGSRLFAKICALGGQIFITGIEKISLRGMVGEVVDQSCWFHVEHGKIVDNKHC